MPTISIIFRALNEAKWFGAALEACSRQILPPDFETEVILVDSGSTDGTIRIAQEHGCQVFHIDKSEFTFGRSLNIGCDGAKGDYLVFVSAHCIPCDEHWLARLTDPLIKGQCTYTYGGQIGLEGVTRFSENQVFAHYYGNTSDLSQDGFFCNNANSAINQRAWARHRFDEAVTGLEDMVLAKNIVAEGGQIGYVADACVTHIHEETLSQTYRRYFREALTMRDIMPEVHFNAIDLTRCFFAGVKHDCIAAAKNKQFFKQLSGIPAYRFMQYWGTYRGHNEHRELSRAQKTRYYYPKTSKRRPTTSRIGRVEDPSKTTVQIKSPY